MSKTFFSQDIFQKNAILLVGFFFYLFVGLGLEEYYGRDQLQLLLNSFHNPFWDVFFKIYTQWSLPVFIGLAYIIIIWKYDYKMGAYLLGAFVLATSVVIFVKRVFFLHGHRPSFYFESKGIDLHLVEGVKSSITYTFPSGHSCNAFLIMLFFSMLFNKNKIIQFICLFLAVLVALSRIYLSKHFVIDTVAGSALGVACNVVAFYIFKNINLPFLDQKIKLK